MRNMWKPSKELLGGYACVELRTSCLGHDNVEYGLSGPRGGLWEEGEGGRYKAIVTHGLSGRRLPEEQLVRFGAVDLGYWVDRLGVPTDPKDQAVWANTFSKRNK